MSLPTDKQSWLDSLKPYALSAQAKWPGMRWQVCLAQAALETAWGKRVIDKSNYWGIKACLWIPGSVNVTTHEWVSGQSIELTLKFAAFNNMQEGFDAYGRLVTNSPYYSAARAADNLADYIRLLSQHWATDPQYTEKILTIIREGGLENAN